VYVTCEICMSELSSRLKCNCVRRRSAADDLDCMIRS